MLNRRSFLRLVRNRIAAGVLCSGMLTDALELVAELPTELLPPKIHYVSSFKVTEKLMQDDLYGIGIAQQMEEFSAEVAETARQKMEEQSGL